jgi:hypothetical protein
MYQSVCPGLPNASPSAPCACSAGLAASSDTLKQMLSINTVLEAIIAEYRRTFPDNEVETEGETRKGHNEPLELISASGNGGKCRNNVRKRGRRW